MKETVASIVLAIAAAATAQTNAPIDNFTLVTNLWWNGYKTNVLQIAEQRLIANSNDLAGLVLKLEYDVEYSKDSLLSNDITLVMSAIRSVTNGFICQNSSFIEECFNDYLDFLATGYNLTAEELEMEKAKSSIINTHMAHEILLKWLHDDKLF